MAHKTYEFKMVFTIDDTNEEAMDTFKDLKEGILSGELQADLMKDAKLKKVKVTLIEVK